ncbi:transcriptional regulator [Erysipelotrichaceae bacterium MTC7]|nr:transcriptional regulator [Erysipelotrichaceae bacterium MTC7]
MGFHETFKALADPVRREILTYLKQGEKSAGDISDQFELSKATISHHLSILKKADLVYERKEKNFIYYGLNTSVFEELSLWVTQFKKGHNE